MLSRFPNCPWRLGTQFTIAERLAIGNELAHEAMGSPAVQALAQRIAADCYGCTKARLAEAALRAVQNLGYVPDFPSDWIQPVEYTLTHGGDCEDGTIAFLAVCRLLGLRALNVWRVQRGQPLDHITAAVALPVGERPSFAGAQPIDDIPPEFRDPTLAWWWADTSIAGAMLGEDVYDAADRLRSHESTRAPGAIDPITGEPVSAETNAQYHLAGTVLNLTGQTVEGILASGNRTDIEALAAAARIRAQEYLNEIAGAANETARAALEQQRQALLATEAAARRAIELSGQQATMTYVVAAVAVAAILGGAYVISQTSQTQAKAA